MRRPPGAERPPAEAEIASSDRLAAAAAHELNNVVASLRGFVELAREAAGNPAGLRNALDEIQLGVQRVAGVAADMWALAVVPEPARAIALGTCTSGDEAGDNLTQHIRWDCAPSLQVMAAPLATRLAIATLARLAPAGTRAESIVCHAPPSSLEPSRCAHCGAVVDAASAWFTLQLPPGRFRHPPGKTRLGIASGSELRHAALVRAAHGAGGHVIENAEPGTLALVLSLA